MSKDKGMKRGCVLLLTVAVVFGMTGCEAADSLFTDAGTDVVQQVDTSQYLDIALLNNPKEEQTLSGYQIYTLEYGTFETDIIGLKGSLNMVEVTPVKAEFDSGSMRLLELCVSRNTYVEKGDVIARVSMETSDLDLEELQLKQLRLEEEYIAYQEDYAVRHEEALASFSVYEYPREIQKVELNQMELDHEQTMRSYEKKRLEYQEKIAELQNTSATGEILAKEAGYVLSVSRLSAGELLKNGEVLCNMAPLNKLLVEFSDETMHYGYGMDLQLKIDDLRNPKPYEVKVVTALGKVLYGNWGDATTKIAGEYEMADLLGKGSFTITGTTNVMKNVLLVPLDAVTQDGDRYYVTVWNEDGSLEKRQFISGGKNLQYYWVYDGLSEGERIVVKD